MVDTLVGKEGKVDIEKWLEMFFVISVVDERWLDGPKNVPI